MSEPCKTGRALPRVGLRRLVRAMLVIAILAARARADETTLGEITFQLPKGFQIEIAAGPPLVERPITIDFDERGRLYVSESSGTNDPVQKQLADRPHRIVRLEDTDGDGRFDKKTVYADHMMFPEGTMWHNGSLFVSAPPQIWKLTDTDDDGVADRREVWFDGKTLTGCANDLHGPYLGPDGFIYWCKGAFAEQTYSAADGAPFKSRAAHVFRRRADGIGPIEPVMTGGMDNPVDLVFMPNGERVFTTTFLVNPGGGQRDGLIHAVYGGIYGKEHDPIFDPIHKWTGPDVMPVLLHMGPAAACGLARYESEVFAPAYRDNLFACQFNMHKVSRHMMSPSGGTYLAKNEDFLTSPDADFHPTDVVEDADGSLLVVNTGGWYKLCCPTSQLHKPDVLGAIYRIRATNAEHVNDPRGLAIEFDRLDAAELVALLDDPRVAVRQRARESLVRAGLPGLGELDSRVRSIEQRRSALWIAARSELHMAAALLRKGLRDPDSSVRQVALHVIALRRLREALPDVMDVLDHADPHNRRAAAEALGRIADPEAVPALLKALAQSHDRAIDHSLTYALIEIADPDQTAAGLRASEPSVRRSALVALDQMGAADRLDPMRVASWMTDKDKALSQSAAWVIGRHPEWANNLASFFRERLRHPSLSASERDTLADQLASISTSSAIQSLLLEILNAKDSSPAQQLMVLRAMAATRMRKLPVPWAEALVDFLADGAVDATRIDPVLELLRGKEIPRSLHQPLTLRLAGLGQNADLADSTRLSALALVPGGLSLVGPALFDYVCGQLDEQKPVAIRLAAADALASAQLTPEQLRTLAKELETIGPLEQARLLPAFARTADESVGTSLIAALRQSPAKASLRAEQLQPILAKYPESIRKAADDLIAELNVDLAQQRAHLDEMLAKLPAGDVRNGQRVFNGQKAACAACHAIGYLGGKIGPDLTRIGSVRKEHDLLESIVYPSLSFVRSYEPVNVAVRDGRVLSGLIKSDTPDEVVLIIGADKEERIPRDQVEEYHPGTVSIMPAGLDQQLTPQELADLVAFLKACQ